MICSKVKDFRSGAKLYVIDPKPGDLAMSRLKWR